MYQISPNIMFHVFQIKNVSNYVLYMYMLYFKIYTHIYVNMYIYDDHLYDIYVHVYMTCMNN